MISREPTQSIQANRGGCLTAFLVLMLIANPLTAIYYFFAGSSVSQSLPNMPAWIIPVYGILCVANFVFAIAIWKWKKWGYYGFAISSGTGVISNVMYIGLQPALSLSGLVGVAILAFLLRQVWNQMD